MDEKIFEEVNTVDKAIDVAAFLMYLLDTFFDEVGKNLGEEDQAKMVLSFNSFMIDKFGELKKLPIADGVMMDKEALKNMLLSQEGEDNE